MLFDISSFLFVHPHWNLMKKKQQHIDRKQPVILNESAVSRQLL